MKRINWCIDAQWAAPYHFHCGVFNRVTPCSKKPHLPFSIISKLWKDISQDRCVHPSSENKCKNSVFQKCWWKLGPYTWHLRFYHFHLCLVDNLLHLSHYSSSSCQINSAKWRGEVIWYLRMQAPKWYDWGTRDEGCTPNINQYQRQTMGPISSKSAWLLCQGSHMEMRKLRDEQNSPMIQNARMRKTIDSTGGKRSRSLAR